MVPTSKPTPTDAATAAPLAPILVLSFLATFGTAVLWNGLGFIAKEAYGFGEGLNLGLAVWNGAIYAVVAFRSGRMLRRLDRLIRPRTVLAMVFLLQVFVCPLVLVGSSAWLLFLVSGAMSALAAFFWPVIEAFVAAGRDPNQMRHAIGWWNATWMTALGLALISISPFLTADRAAWAIGAARPHQPRLPRGAASLPAGGSATPPAPPPRPRERPPRTATCSHRTGRCFPSRTP